MSLAAWEAGMNRKERRAAKFKTPKPTLRELVTSLGLAAPWCMRARWGAEPGHAAEMSLAGREVLRRHQYAADLAACVLLIGNHRTTLCIGDDRAGYDSFVRRGELGQLPPYEQWRSTMVFAGDRDRRHVILRAQGSGTKAFVDLTFGQVAMASKGRIEAPPAFAFFGDVEWPTTRVGEVWLAYGRAPEAPALSAMPTEPWRELIDDLAGKVDVALGCGNDGHAFDAVMERQRRPVVR
jgi:hypothetical protein